MKQEKPTLAEGFGIYAQAVTDVFMELARRIEELNKRISVLEERLK